MTWWTFTFPPEREQIVIRLAILDSSDWHLNSRAWIFDSFYPFSYPVSWPPLLYAFNHVLRLDEYSHSLHPYSPITLTLFFNSYIHSLSWPLASVQCTLVSFRFVSFPCWLSIGRCSQTTNRPLGCVLRGDCCWSSSEMATFRQAQTTRI